MRFSLIDRIVDIQPGQSIRAMKALSLAEEYLQDHFPRFPVMPGVLMLEAMSQTARWLIYLTDDFAHPCVMLREARNVKYADFVEPGQVLWIDATIVKEDGLLTTVKTQGMVGEKVAVSARLLLERQRPGADDPSKQSLDLYTERRMREIFQLLYHPAAVASTTAPSVA